jgi:ribosomal protein S6
MDLLSRRDDVRRRWEAGRALRLGGRGHAGEAAAAGRRWEPTVGVSGGPGLGAVMPAYETTIMISTLTSRKRTIDLLKSVINLVLEKKGVVMDVNSLGTRALAYDIKKHKQTHSSANYAILNMYTSPTTLKEAHKMLRYDENVVRFMSIRQSR